MMEVTTVHPATQASISANERPAHLLSFPDMCSGSRSLTDVTEIAAQCMHTLVGSEGKWRPPPHRLGEIYDSEGVVSVI